jgi:hypothetical protein
LSQKQKLDTCISSPAMNYVSILVIKRMKLELRGHRDKSLPFGSLILALCLTGLRSAPVPTWSSSLRESRLSSSSAISVGPFLGLLLLDRAHYHNCITSAIEKYI